MDIIIRILAVLLGLLSFPTSIAAFAHLTAQNTKAGVGLLLLAVVYAACATAVFLHPGWWPLLIPPLFLPSLLRLLGVNPRLRD